MFEKLLAILPYNPSLASQLSFYGRRMREEAIIRRTGLIFLVLTFIIQFFAVLSPPQPTVADSDNNLISGGISSAADAAAKCNANLRHYRDIMENYNITCADIGAAGTLTIHSKGQDYYSMGWVAYNRPGSNETPVNVPNTGTLYFRKLSSFDTGANAASKDGSAYDNTLRVTNSAGNVYYILAGCGNLVSVGIPVPFVPPAPAPAPAPTSSPTAPPVASPSPSPTPVTCLAYQFLINGTCINDCKFNPKIPVNSPQCFQPCPYNKSIAIGTAQCYKPCPYNSLLAVGDSNCKPCDKSVSSQDTLACISVHKKATNVTAGIANANGTTAQPGDVITYTLSASNNGKATVKGFVFQESLSDVLDYANATDLHGGTIDNYGTVTWPAEDITAGQTATQQIAVTVKNPIPSTPADPTNPNHFDLTMTNVYGDTINIKVPTPPVKAIQMTAAALPNTGPGTSLFVAAAIVIVAGYFYGRARLLAKESTLAIQQNAGS